MVVGRERRVGPFEGVVGIIWGYLRIYGNNGESSGKNRWTMTGKPGLYRGL